MSDTFSQRIEEARKYRGLRHEVDHFIEIVRRLNSAALAVKQHKTPQTSAVFDETRELLRASLERMAHLAGMTDEELAELSAASGAVADEIVR